MSMFNNYALLLTEKWKSVNGFRFGDPSVLFGIPKLCGHYYQDIQVGTATYANQSTLLQVLPKLRCI